MLTNKKFKDFFQKNVAALQRIKKPLINQALFYALHFYKAITSCSKHLTFILSSLKINSSKKSGKGYDDNILKPFCVTFIISSSVHTKIFSLKSMVVKKLST